jgi:hypothetical protein
MRELAGPAAPHHAVSLLRLAYGSAWRCLADLDDFHVVHLLPTPWFEERRPDAALYCVVPVGGIKP